jgi:hypothetical protein
MRFFNTAGPVKCQDHYCLPPLSRFDLDGVMALIAQKKYFVLHAPRQTGKTTCLLALMNYLNQGGQYRAAYVNVENGQAARGNVAAGMKAILVELAAGAEDALGDPFIRQTWRQTLEEVGEFAALGTLLSRWAAVSPLPLVLLIDEIDALVGDTLISVLRQLRTGYPKRPAGFPSTAVLCGVRDVRDYRYYSEREKEPITGGSAFNIKAESLRLGDFVQDEVRLLYAQHMTETGQLFEPAALEAVWELTLGQPWLVNALGYETCFKMIEGRDRSRPITTAMVAQAAENLILRRETHLDQLTDKLREDRVRRVIQGVLTGDDAPTLLPEDDLQYVADLGLIRRKPSVVIANPIYREIIPRALTSVTQDMLAQEAAWYVRADGQLDLARLLTAFQQFFREHSESWIQAFDYREAGPQLLLQAFLQRIVNSGGQVQREYGLGRKRTDLLVIWPYAGGIQRAVIELKILCDSLERTIADGLAQTWEYADRCAADEAHLVVFDRDAAKPWAAKVFRREEVYRGATARPAGFPVTVWGM